MPTVSIGLPVYNAGPTLPKIIESIQSQSYTDYEVVAFDNCSTDNSAALLKDYALKDSRMRLITRSENAGPEANFKDVFHNSTGEFFTWWAADDWRSPDWLESSMQTLTENPQAIATMPAYCFDYDIENKDNWHSYSLEGDNRLATLMDNYHLSHSVFYALIKTRVVLTWFEEHGFVPINGFDWLFILYLVCSGDVVRTPGGLMIGGTHGDSRRGWLYQRTLLENHIPLYRVYAKIDEMIQAAEGISATQKSLACARLLGRNHEVGEQISRYWNTLNSPLIPLNGFSSLDSFDGGTLVQWCNVSELDARTGDNLSIALSDTRRTVGTYIYNPGNEIREITFINPVTRKRIDVVVNSGMNRLDMVAIRKQLLEEGYSAIYMRHNFPVSEIQPTFGAYKIYFGIVRDFNVKKLPDYNPMQASWFDKTLTRLTFKTKCLVRGLISDLGTK
jgi:glycosyltransferase involved in cell wall biosynthesis